MKTYDRNGKKIDSPYKPIPKWIAVILFVGLVFIGAIAWIKTKSML